MVTKPLIFLIFLGVFVNLTTGCVSNNRSNGLMFSVMNQTQNDIGPCAITFSDGYAHRFGNLNAGNGRGIRILERKLPLGDVTLVWTSGGKEYEATVSVLRKPAENEEIVFFLKPDGVVEVVYEERFVYDGPK